MIFTLNFTALNSVQMQPLFTAQSSPNAGLFQFPLAGNYTQVGGMPVKIRSLWPDSKMCCCHLGRRAWWQVSPPSSPRDPCLGVCCSVLQPHLRGEEVLTAGHSIKPHTLGLGAAQGWALTDLGPLPDVLLGLQGFLKLSQACSERCVLSALQNQNTNRFFVSLDINFLSCHALISLKSCVGCCRRGTGSMFCEGSRVWLFCRLVCYKKWVVFLSVFSRPHLTLFISFILSLSHFFSKLKSFLYISSSIPQTICVL